MLTNFNFICVNKTSLGHKTKRHLLNHSRPFNFISLLGPKDSIAPPSFFTLVHFSFDHNSRSETIQLDVLLGKQQLTFAKGLKTSIQGSQNTRPTPLD